jgi:hypothetical protein
VGGGIVSVGRVSIRFGDGRGSKRVPGGGGKLRPGGMIR